jgi:ADP-heptose:LPS heptosyltransferase
MTVSAPDRAALPPPADVRTMLCLMLGEIGDFVVTTPALAALRERYPNARITLLGRPSIVDLISASELVDELLTLKAKSGIDRIRVLAQLAARSWDLFVDLHVPTFNTISDNARVFLRNAILMRIAGCRFRRGFATAQTAPYLTHPETVPDDGVLTTENIAVTTRRLTPSSAVIRKRLGVVPEARADVARACAERGWTDRPLIAVFFGAKQPAKIWPLSMIQEFLTKLPASHPGHAVVILGGSSESWLAAALAKGEAARHPDMALLIGNTTLAQTAAWFERARLVVATDSGPAHVAEALDRPLVALYSSHNYRIWEPLAPSTVVLRHDVECSPCFLSSCPKDNLCMRLIEPAQVLLAMKKFA